MWVANILAGPGDATGCTDVYVEWCHQLTHLGYEGVGHTGFLCVQIIHR